ncbi:hypothetical protein AN958_09005 [Leucoagaricus sp. SymC.cos]|nr:hypothetical protein AN958_09005 [Leucoagaricus sp. SymC.cos]
MPQLQVGKPQFSQKANCTHSSKNQQATKSCKCISRLFKRVSHSLLQRCDGQRPICGPCAKYRGHELDDCEFYEGQPPLSQVLQERVEDLENQIEMLQGVKNPGRVPLHTPYVPMQSATPSEADDQHQTLPANKIHPLWVETSFPGPLLTGVNRLTHFGSFASDVGFFLDPERFMRSAMQPHNVGHHSRPCPSLLFAVCLWGSKSFLAAAQRNFEETWLNQALRFVTEDLSGSHPRRCLQVMQAEILLSTYFLNYGKSVEGLVHANAAAALAVSTKSNLIRSASVMQKPSGDAVDEGEWIDGFWTTVTLSNYWVLVNENQTFTFYDTPQMKIDTPWPLNDYRQEKLIPASHKTLERYLEGAPDDGYSLLAMHAKASVLLKKAIENSQTSDPESAYQYNIIHNVLEQLAVSLPKLDAQMSPQQRQRIAVIHMLTQAAVIKLHRPKGRTSNTARQNCVRAARTIAELALRCPTANPLQIVNPIIGFVLFIAHDILRTEIRFLHEQRAPEDNRLSDAINHILQRMETDVIGSPLIGNIFNSDPPSLLKSQAGSLVRNMRNAR